ncbi:MAG: SUMF1/EgtB/PvdO family nonheme iron enzyme [Flavobacteriaceae bacterium]|nr:SUMF1/EgtB/PvdO family nonheme iron enzyme [Flavobacteriaceae bacterium]
MENAKKLFNQFVDNNTNITNVYAKFQINALENIFSKESENIITDNLCIYPNLSTSFYLNNNPVEKGVEFSSINEIFNAKRDYNYFILLGESGYGKSTLLKKIRIDYLLSSLQNNKEQVCLFFEFKNYTQFSNHLLLDVLNERWKNIAPSYMPTFSELIKQGKVLLLLDAINEIKCYNNDLVDTISRCIAEISSINSNNKVIVSCRTSSYFPSWFTFPERLVEIDIKAFNSDKIQTYLSLTAPEIAEQIFKLIKKDGLLTFYSVPYYLSLLVGLLNNHEMRNNIGIPTNLNNLFEQFIKTAIIREIRNTNSIFINDELMTKEYQNYLIRTDTLEVNRELIKKSPFFNELSLLAFNKFNQACPIIENITSEVSEDKSIDNKIVEAALCLGFIELHKHNIVFKHHLLQSYFASIHFYCEFEKNNSLITSLTLNIDNSWKDTLLFVASFINEQDKLKVFINYFKKIDFILSCECVAQEKDKLDESYIDDFRNEALEKSTLDTNISNRIIAGLILGKLGDIRFKISRGIEKVNIIIPPLERIEGDIYQVHYVNNKKLNIDTINVNSFLIGKYPITNLEYSKFIEAGGYDDQKYWESDIAKAWLHGDWKEWVKTEWLNKHKILQKRKLLSLFLLMKGTTTIFQSYSIYKMTHANEDEIIKMLETIYQKREIYTRVPRFWYDPDFNNPSQPVLGVSWIEANAYCKWLSVQSGKKFRLPTEWEWEIVARGKAGLRFPYGNDFNKKYCNIYDSDVAKSPTPVGIFPEGNPQNVSCFDLSGNVFEWTDSFYTESDKKYVHANSVISIADIYKTVSCRGGAWSHIQIRATGYYRGRGNVFTRNNDLGFRVLCEI